MEVLLIEFWHYNTGKTETGYNGIKNKHREKLSGQELKKAKAKDKFDEGDIEIDTVTGLYGTSYNPDKYDHSCEFMESANG